MLSAATQIIPLSTSALSSQFLPAMVPTYQIEPASDGADQTAGPQGFTPSQIRDAYGMNQVSFGGVTGNGAGQTIALIDAYNDPTIQSDLSSFDAAFGLASTTLTVVNQSGGSTLPPVDPAGPGTDDWEVEEALDVEWAHAMAPGADIILVEASDSSPSNLFAAANWARQQTDVSVVSMSFGGNETTSETQYDSIFTTPSGHNGVTFVASTGDSSAPAGYPAYSPNVLAVGGTELAVDSLGNYVSETGWSGSGGGISQVEAQPSYQNGVVTQSTTNRTAPDVAFDANPSSGVSVYDSYNNGTTDPWDIIGGTSLGAPSWAGIIAVANQGRVIAGVGTLQSNSGTLPLIYSAPTTDFHDITSGNNGYSAGPGYDLVTGRGSPVANLLIPYLVTGTVVTPPPPQGPSIGSITANPTSVPEGDQFTLTANNASDPGATGVVLTFFEETNGVTGLQTGSGGDYSFTPITNGSDSITLNTTGATPGTYIFYAQLTDASRDASPAGASAPTVSVVITAPSGANSGPVIGSIVASPNPVVSGNSLTLTATNITDPDVDITDVIFYEETNGIPGLQTGRGGDFSFRPVGSATGFSIVLNTTGVTGSRTFYALAIDALGNESAVGASAPSVVVDITSDTPPDAPTGLTARSVSSSEIDLSFSEISSGQTGFNIERSTDPTFQTFTQLFSINFPDVTTYDDTGLTPDTTYYYRVDAFDSAGDSTFSNTGHATTAPAQLAFGSEPTTTSAGQSLGTVVIDVQDQSGKTLATDNSYLTISVDTGPSSALNGTLTVQAVAGVATFTGLSLDVAGSYTLKAADSADGAPPAASDSFVVNAAAAAQLIWATQPNDATAGVVISPAVRVEIEDQFGNIVASSDSITLSVSSGPSATINGALSEPATGGIAIFSDLSLDTAGAYVFQASDATENIPAIASDRFTVSSAAASQLVFTGQPVDLTAGSPPTPDITVEAQDPFGNLDPTYDSNVLLAIKVGPADVNFVPITVRAINGIATFSNLVLDTAGAYKFSATHGALSGKSARWTVNPAAAAQLAIVQEPTEVAAGTIISPAVVVDFEDQFGNLVSTKDRNITLSLKRGPADGLIGGTLTVAAANGAATFGDLILDTAGVYKFMAMHGAMIAKSTKLTVIPAAPSTLVFAAQPSDLTAGTPQAPITVDVLDEFGNLESDDSSTLVTLGLKASPSGAVFTPIQMDDMNGVATFTDVTLETPGDYKFAATSPGLIAGKSAKFVVTA